MGCWWITREFSRLQIRQFCLLPYPSSWTYALSLKMMLFEKSPLSCWCSNMNFANSWPYAWFLASGIVSIESCKCRSVVKIRYIELLKMFNYWERWRIELDDIFTNYCNVFKWSRWCEMMTERCVAFSGRLCEILTISEVNFLCLYALLDCKMLHDLTSKVKYQRSMLGTIQNESSFETSFTKQTSRTS